MSVFSLAPASDAAPNVEVSTIAYDPVAAQMIANGKRSDVYNYDASLSGKTPLTVGGQSFTMSTRNLKHYPEYVDKATQDVYEFMQARGLAVSYHNWSDSYMTAIMTACCFCTFARRATPVPPPTAPSPKYLLTSRRLMA